MGGRIDALDRVELVECGSISGREMIVGTMEGDIAFVVVCGKLEIRAWVLCRGLFTPWALESDNHG